MAETTNLNIRIDKDLKERAEAVFADICAPDLAAGQNPL